VDITPSAVRCARRAALLAAVAARHGRAGPAHAAAAARACTPPAYPSAGYFDRLTVTGASCPTGSRVALAYYRCRIRAGGLTGRCPGGVLGYRCREVRHTDSTELLARVTCRRGRATIVHVYTQHLAS
jgi:hypothetical protein